MESPKIGELLILTGQSNKQYLFRVYKLAHDFSKYKKHYSMSALFLVTTQKVKESGLVVHNTLYWNKIIDLSKLSFSTQLKATLKEKGATHICVLRRTKPDVIEKIELDLKTILK